MSFLSFTINPVGYDTSVEQKCNGTKTMCNVCCKEFKGWCKSFTRTEALLSLLEAFLLLVFIGFLTFLILHFLACSQIVPTSYEIIPPSSTVSSPISTATSSRITSAGGAVITPDANEEFGSTRQTLAPDVQCTWEPSKKTAATARYYEHGAGAPAQTTAEMEKTPPKDESDVGSVSSAVPAGLEDSDGEEVAEGEDSFVLALVKLRPARESTFGCALTVVSRFWVLTAASCLEAVEEVDSLDAFVIVEGWGAAAEARVAHAVADVRVHPQFATARRSRDVAALRSEDPLTIGSQGILQLPTVLDHLLITIGERFTILGYGRFRFVDIDLCTYYVKLRLEIRIFMTSLDEP